MWVDSVCCVMCVDVESLHIIKIPYHIYQRVELIEPTQFEL